MIKADDTFTVNEHPVIMSNVYGPETIDGRLEQKGWSTCSFDDSGWKRAVVVSKADEPKGKPVEQFQPAIKIIADYDGKCVGTVGNIRDIYDFGQNMSGILEFEVRGKSGDMVKFYPAEKLQKNGDVDQEAKNWVTVDSCITYIIGNNEWEKVRMKFTYFAGRFVAVEKIPVENSPPSSASMIEIRNLRAYAISSAWKTDGTFTSDDERFNKIYDMIEKNCGSKYGKCPYGLSDN